MDNCKWQSANFKSTGNYTSSQVTYYIINHQDITEGLSRAHLTDPHKLNHFLFQCWLYFRANAPQFPTDEEKINFVMTYFSSIVQDWFEVVLQQEDLSYAQLWLFI